MGGIRGDGTFVTSGVQSYYDLKMKGEKVEFRASPATPELVQLEELVAKAKRTGGRISEAEMDAAIGALRKNGSLGPAGALLLKDLLDAAWTGPATALFDKTFGDTGGSVTKFDQNQVDQSIGWKAGA